ARHAIEASERCAGDRARHVAQRHPIEFGEATVDLAGAPVEIALQALIFEHVFARACGDLEIAHLDAMLRETIEQPRERLESIGQTLRVIEAIDADDERAVEEALVEATCRLPRRRPACLPGKGAGIDADGCCDRQHDAALGLDADAWNWRQAQNR